LTGRYDSVILDAVKKVAVTIPDPVFQAADRVARRMRIPRSQFYARALESFVKSQSSEDVTARLDDVYAKVEGGADPVWQEGSLRLLRRSKW
jgi:predicted transcriptional regulator